MNFEIHGYHFPQLIVASSEVCCDKVRLISMAIKLRPTDAGRAKLRFLYQLCGKVSCFMGLLPDTQNCGCACAGNAGNVFPVTAGKRSRHASRHVRHARAVMHAGIANYRFPLKSTAGENVPGIPGACATCNFTYLVRGPCTTTYILGYVDKCQIYKARLHWKHPTYHLTELVSDEYDNCYIINIQQDGYHSEKACAWPCCHKHPRSHAFL